MDKEELIDEFERELEHKVTKIIKEASGYRLQAFINLATSEGCYNAAKTLISKPGNTEGLTKLLSESRTDL